MMRGLRAIVVALLLTSVGYCQSEQKSTTTTEQKQTPPMKLPTAIGSTS